MHADDLPPSLRWEGAIWQLYTLVETQVRTGPMGVVIGLDYNPLIAIAREHRLDLMLTISLVKEIEQAALAARGKG